MGKLIYMQSELPPFNSDAMKGLAKHIIEGKLNPWSEGRRGLEEQWLQNDRAYLCKQSLPLMDTMPYIDSSPYGGNQIFEGVNNLVMRLALQMMPPNMAWLTPVPRYPESPEITNKTRSQQIWMHQKARTRRSFARHLKQLVVRGSSHILLKWVLEYVYKQLSTRVGRRRLKAYMKATGQDPSVVAAVGKVREEQLSFNGPVLRVVDSYDMYFDSEMDIVNDRRPAYVLQTFRRPSDLLAERDEFGEPMYTNVKFDSMDPDAIVPFKATDVYAGRVGSTVVQGWKRLQSLNNMGVFPQNNTESSTPIVPVYVYYSMYTRWEGMEFYDTYFHVAISARGNEPRIIKIEENPSIDGHRHIVTDTYIDWFTNTAYGISGVEKLLSAYGRANFLSALWMNAAAASQFPPYLLASGILKDDTINLGPGGITEIAAAAIGADVIKPIPTPDKGMQLGFDSMNFLDRKIGESFENAGAYRDNAENMKSGRETATSVNYRATNQGLAIDETAEKFNDSLQEVCQWCYDMNQQTAEAEIAPDGKEIISYGEMQGNNIVRGELMFDEWKRPRNIEILGTKGAQNKEQNKAEKREALQVVTQAAPVMPNAPALVQKITKSLLDDLNIETQPEDWMDPMQLAAQNPMVQMAALQQGLHNPEMLAQMMAPELQGGMNGGNPTQNPNGGQAQGGGIPAGAA